MPSKLELIQELAEVVSHLYRSGNQIEMELFPEVGYSTLKNFRHLTKYRDQTISNLARFHHVSRQRMTAIVEEWEKIGWIQFVVNPRHKTARFVQLTAKGHKLFDVANQRELVMLSTMEDQFTAQEIYTAITTIRRLHNAILQYHQRTCKEHDNS